jgi:hypothetical protein
MTPLRRWSEEGATADEIALLEASRRERPSARAQVRALRALGVAAAATTIGTTAPVAAATKSGLTFLGKIAILSLVGGGVVAGGVAVRAVRNDARAPLAPAAVAVARPASAAPPGSARKSDENPVPTPSAMTPPPPADVSPVHAGAPPRPPRPAASNDALAAQLKALELAHRALAAHDPRSALALLDRYRAQFPGGSLSSEATVLRVQALLESGDRARAQALVDAYVSAHPDSPYARRLEEIVRGE